MQEQYKVEILPTAWEDLKSIEDYYLLQFGVESAMKVTEQILNSIERLELYPDSGSLTPDKWLNRKGYRMVIKVCFYLSTDRKNSLCVSYCRYTDRVHQTIFVNEIE